MLSKIAESLTDPVDLQNLRLVDKRFHTAVGESGIRLRPHKALTNGQLSELGRLLPSASSLDLIECQKLDDESLRALPSLFPCLRQVCPTYLKSYSQQAA